MYNVFYLRLGSTSIERARHVKTRNDNGLRIWIFSQKLPFSVEKKNVSKTVQYTIPIHHITYISDSVWFQRSCGSMKSVSSFSSIDSQVRVRQLPLPGRSRPNEDGRCPHDYEIHVQFQDLKKKILEMNVSGEIMVMVEDWIIWDVFRTSYGWMIISISVNLQAIVNSCKINVDFKLLKLNRFFWIIFIMLRKQRIFLICNTTMGFR